MNMTLPAIFLGIIISSLIGSVFHFWKDGGLGRLILYIVFSWVGFWVGHIVAAQMELSMLSVGPLHLGAAIAGNLIFLGFGHWVSLVRID